MRRLSTVQQFIVFGLMGVMMFLAMCFTAGCGEMMVPGGTSIIQFQPGKGFYVRSNKDTAFGKLSIDPATGMVVVENYSGNGSNLGAQQAATSQLALQMSTQSYLATLELARAIGVPILGGIGGVGGVGGVATPATDTQAELRAALLAKIAACPSMTDNQKTLLTAAVKAAPPAYLQLYLGPIVEKAVAQVTQ